MKIFLKANDEPTSAYIDRVCTLRSSYGLTWEELASIINEQCGLHYSETHYRKNFKKKTRQSLQIAPAENIVESKEDTLSQETYEELIKIRKERMKLTDVRTQCNADLRTLSRREMLQSIAHDIVEQMSAKKALKADYESIPKISNASAILEISDWHYGIEVDNHWNKYDTDICKTRVSSLLAEVLYKCRANNVSEIHVVNLADLICGRIHLPLRLQSKIDVITQVIEVSEILAEFLTDLSTRMVVHYYDCLDNHSRLEPNKSDAVDTESLVRIITWYLKERLRDNKRVIMHENAFGDDIITFEVLGYKVAGVHGDKDKPVRVVDNLSLMTHERFDLILTAHMHHFSCDEKNEILVVSNGSLMGTDEYAKGLRLSSKPSQNLIIVTKPNVAECIYRIILN